MRARLFASVAPAVKTISGWVRRDEVGYLSPCPVYGAEGGEAVGVEAGGVAVVFREVGEHLLQDPWVDRGA